LICDFILRNTKNNFYLFSPQDFFGESWKKVQSENRAVNAMQACERFGCSATELNEVWKKSEAGSKVSLMMGIHSEPQSSYENTQKA